MRHALNIPLSDDASELLQMYALPHVHRHPPNPKNVNESLRLKIAFEELKEKGMVRQGVGRAIVEGEQKLVCDGTETIEEFVAKTMPVLVEAVGWVATKRGMEWIATNVLPENREKALAVMKTFVADEDPGL